MGDSQEQSLSKLSLWQPESPTGAVSGPAPQKLQMHSQRLWGPRTGLPLQSGVALSKALSLSELS